VLPDPATVVPYDPEWLQLFAALGGLLRDALGPVAVRIDHIGSTAVPGLCAKPIIDVQVSVASLEPVAPFRGPMERCGFVWRPDNPDLTKRYFRERPGNRRTHIHVRRSGSFSEQVALLFRDFLRVDSQRAAAYADVKLGLAHLLRVERSAYVAAKGPFVWETFRLADEWAQRTGWQPGPSDA
jgi:GrpB-like predicted nucleotidyltransferase (UPF0157 family)